MATVYLAPSFGAGYQGFSAGGLPLNTGTITTYLAGGTTPKETYTTSAGSVQCANPIVLGLDGRPSTEIWLVSGFAYRFDLKDSLGNLIKTYDNLSGIGDPLIAASVFGASLIAGASATVDRGLLGLADATAKGDTLSAAAAGAFTRKAVGADGSMIVADSAQTDGLLWLAQYPQSLAPNPFFMVDQRVNSATSRADDTYASDRWYVLTQTASINVTTQTDQENGQPYNVRLIQNQAAAQRMGYATIIEGKDCKNLRGQQVTFRPRVRISNSQAVRIAVLEWTGAEDAVTSDVVRDWTSGTYTAANFFLAGLTVSGVGAKTPSAATWTDMDALTVTLGSSFNNLILFAWTEGTAAQNVTLDIGKVRFVQGAYGVSNIYLPTFRDQLAACQRYFDKSFPYGTAPASGLVSDSGASICPAVRAGAVSQIGGLTVFSVRKRAPPTITFFNPAAAGAQVRDNSAAADCSATSVYIGSDGSFVISFTGAAGTAVGNIMSVSWTAAADL